jgi:hypothetical protein
MKTAATKTDSPREASGSHADVKPSRAGGIGLAGRTPAMLTIGHAGDAAEREADMLTAKMLAGIRVRPTRHAPPVSRKCAACEEEEKGIVRRKCAACEEEARVRRDSASGGDVHGGQPAPPSVASLMAQPGRALDPATRGFFENRLGVELGGVRVHDSGAADTAARAIGARAFTVGNHVAFARGVYQPQSEAGLRLLGHELVHVAQNRDDGATVRRLCTHDGTPTNCHNWLLPLPPWTAGSIAHQQVAVWAGIPPGTIPRGTKLWPSGIPTTSFTPPGFADLWSNTPAQVEIGEIKSTQTGSGVAAAEATHYMTRHAEWLGRLGSPPLDRQDSLYLGMVGSPKLSFPLNLSSRTGTGLPIGPFAGDPGKVLNVEADAVGAVVYWCTGPGLTNPLWLIAFKNALDALRRRFQALKRQIEQMIDGIVGGVGAAARWMLQQLSDAADWISEHMGTILLVLLAILLVVLIIVFWAEILVLLAAAAAAVTAAAAEIAAVVGLATAAAGILLLLGIAIPEFAPSTRAVASALRPDAADTTVTGASYDPATNAPTSSATATAQLASIADPGARVLAALSPIGDSDTLIDAAMAAARGNVNEARLRAAMRNGVSALSNAGDANGAALMQGRLRDAGIG